LTGAGIILSPHAALKHRAQGDVLVLPEQAIRLGGSGAEILRLCDEQRTRQELAEILRARYPDAAGLEDEVARFVDEMLSLGGLIRVDPDQRGPHDRGNIR
jgi:hypothetical protein